jgi:hypothetical protein
MKNQNTPQVIAMSANLGYIFTNKGVSKLSYETNDLNGRNFVPYTFEHLNIASQILKENIDFKYKIGSLSLNEYTSEPRKFLNLLIEEFQPDNRISILREWEERFGNKLLLINESSDNLIIEERVNNAWDGITQIILEGLLGDIWGGIKSVGSAVATGVSNLTGWVKDKAVATKDWVVDQGKQIKDKGILGWAADKAKNVWNYVKDKIAAAWNCVKSGLECIMEGIRSLVTSAGGTAVLTGLSFVPVVGQVTNAVIFGALLLWDLYLMSQGKGNWVNILVDAMALILPSAAKLLKSALVGVKSFGQLGAAAASKGGILAKVVNAFKSKLTTLGGYITKAATWLGEKLGMTTLANWGKNATAKLASLSDEMAAGAKGATGTAKTAATTGVKKTVAAGTKKTVTANANKVAASKLGSKASQEAMKKATPLQQLKTIWAKNPKAPIPPTGTIVNAMGKSFLLTAGICAALGLDGFTCADRVDKGQVTPEQLKVAEEKAQMELAQQLTSNPEGTSLGLTDADIEAL